MIQRIQSVYLLVGALAVTMLIFFPIAEFYSADQQFRLLIGGLKPGLENSGSTILLLIFTPLLASIMLFTILKFKDRKFQLKLNMVSLFVNMALLISIFYYTDSISKLTNFNGNYKYLFAAYLPVISILTIILANRAIRSDEKMLKKSDRIR